MVNKNKLAFKLLQEWPFQTNAVLLKFLFIKEFKKICHGFHKKNNGCWKFSFAITGINYILKYINIKTTYFKLL